MKKITYILIASVLLLIGCSDEYGLNDNNQGLNVQLLQGEYVAFSANGANTTIPPLDAEEGDASIAFNIEIPTGTESDVTINYSISGTAVFGTDFTIVGATAAGGSVLLVPDDGSGATNIIDNVDILVDCLTDDVVDGDKTVIITLESASNADGEVLVGRAGTDLLRSQTLTIADID